MTRHSILKKTFLYKHIYRPYRAKQEKAVADRKHTIFMQYGAQVLVHFAKSMQQAGLDYWLEFGTLLGAYRDGTFVPNELDLGLLAGCPTDLQGAHPEWIPSSTRVPRCRRQQHGADIRVQRCYARCHVLHSIRRRNVVLRSILRPLEVRIGQTLLSSGYSPSLQAIYIGQNNLPEHRDECSC